MTRMPQMILTVTCALTLTLVLGALPAQGVSLREENARWRLELEPHMSPQHRARRHVFPGTGMPCLTVAFLTEMKGRFRERIDPNDDGKATASEVRQYLSNFNPGVTDDQVNRFITRRDLNGNGIIEFVPEYILDIATPDMTPEAASEWFELEDSDHNGYVTRAELLRIAQRLGMTPKQADVSVSSYYMTVDADKDDKLSFDEYKVLYSE